MVLESGEVLKAILMRDNGLKIGNKAKEYSSIQQVLIVDSIKIFLNMDLDSSFSQMATYIQDIIRMENQKAKANTNGKTEKFMKVILKTVKDKAMEYK